MAENLLELSDIKLGTEIGRSCPALMKMSLNKIRGSKAVKNALCAGVVIFSTAGVVAPQIPALKPVIVTLPAGVTSAEIQRTLDLLPERGGEVVLPPGNFEVRQPIVLQRCSNVPKRYSKWIL